MIASVSRGTGSNVPLAFTYTYDGEGNLYELRNFETHRSTVFRYDHAGRCMASVEKTFTGNAGGSITYTATVASYSYSYDSCNRLSKLTRGTGNDTWETVYTYDNDGKAKTVTLQNGKVLTNTYDSLGRLQYRDIGLTSAYRTALTYLAGDGTNAATALLATYTNGSDAAYTYAYDANGNITEITQGSTSVSNTYNAANELIRENNGFTGETVLYSYDPWGNILEKVTYAYTTAEEPQSPAETVIYSYGNTVWHDELTGRSITTTDGTETETFTYLYTLYKMGQHMLVYDL